MRIVKTRAALLSDYEVLQLLRDTETRQREAARPDNEDAEAWMKAVPPNVRTIQFELVEELGQRMSDEQIDDILQCVMTHLPAPQAQVEPLEVEAQPVLDEAPDTYAADEMAVDEDAFPEEHFEHEGPSTAVAADDDDD
ncbi:hypothetical protein CBS14141_001053 [Malassezia furfur]|nr:hypothetical protein CBS14141_001051 [Malassezia furfur]KAI3627052.1 hypothetical protein CBS14141_001053 [Malassezia furfur]